MNLRKINAIISMLIVVLLLDHAMFYAVVMLSRYRIPTHATVLPWVITACCHSCYFEHCNGCVGA